MTDAAQQQLISARKAQLLDVAAALFAEKGFHSTTTRDIAARAGLSEGTIYNYFANKHALLVGILEQMRAALVADGAPPATGATDLHAAIRSLVQQPLRALEEHNYALFRIVISETLVNEEMRRLYRERILEPTLALAETHFQALAAARGLTPIESRLAIRALSGMVLGLMLEDIMGDETVRAEREALPDFLAGMILDGLPDRSG